MITEQELTALVSLLNRTPITPAEQLWLQALLQRLAAEIQAAKQKGSVAEP